MHSFDLRSRSTTLMDVVSTTSPVLQNNAREKGRIPGRFVVILIPVIKNQPVAFADMLLSVGEKK